MSPDSTNATILDQAWVLLRVLAAVLLAGAIGFERGISGKAAGFRTHILVGMSAALFVGLAELAVVHFPLQQVTGDEVGLRYDPIRVLQAIVIGVGFLGSGSILIDRARGRTVGLTTAASIWGTAGVGMACGLGLYVTALGATALYVLVLHLLPRLDRQDE